MGLCVLTPLFSDRTIHIDISFFWLLGESPIVVAIPMPSPAKARECRFLRRLSYNLVGEGYDIHRPSLVVDHLQTSSLEGMLCGCFQSKDFALRSVF